MGSWNLQDIVAIKMNSKLKEQCGRLLLRLQQIPYMKMHFMGRHCMETNNLDGFFSGLLYAFLKFMGCTYIVCTKNAMKFKAKFIVKTIELKGELLVRPLMKKNNFY